VEAILIILAVLVVIAVMGAVIYLVTQARLRDAKNIERGLKMIPMLIHLPPTSDDTDVGGRDVRDVIEEKISQAETLYSVIASTAKSGFKSKFYGQRHIAFEIVVIKGVVNYYVVVPIALQAVVQQAILGAYPTAQLEEVQEHNIFNEAGRLSGVYGGEIHLSNDFAYPISTFKENKRDVMVSLLNALSSLSDEDGAALQLLIRPARKDWQKSAKSTAGNIKKDKGKKNGFKDMFSPKDLLSALANPPEANEAKPEDKQLSSLEQSTVDAIEQKTRYAGYEVLIRVVASSNTSQKAQTATHNIVAAFSLFNSQGLNGFKFSEAKDIEKFVTAYIFRFFPPSLRKDILNSVELATIFHLPDSQFSPTSQLQRQASKQVDGPRNMPKEGLLMGYNSFRGIKKEVRLTEDDRRRHMYIVGQTGTGKSVYLENLALQDMLAGNGFAFIDPHGDTVESIISMVPKERTEDVIYFNPGDMDNPLGLNLFEHQLPEQRDFLIQETINMLYRLYDPQHQGIIGPRYEHWFRNAALTVMAGPDGGTFIEIPKVFTDKNFLNEKLKHVTDPTVLDFWNKEMAQTSDYHKSEVLGWFVSKFGAFMSNEMMRNIIGQPKSSFDLRDIMDNKKILLVNLSKGRTGELNSMLLGMIFIMKFQAAAMSRATVPQDQRVDFSLYVDEFQNFSTDSFATILSEARKYRLNLIVANQFIGQLTDEIRDAVFGNVGTIITLRCSATDAEFLVKQYSPTFDVQDLVKLPNYNALVVLLVRGVPSQPFSMVTIPPLGSPNEKLGNALKQLSSAKHGKPRKVAEKEIFKRLAIGDDSKSTPGPTGRANNSPPKPGAPKPGSSSFLDDWLAKRKKQSGATGPDKSPAAVKPSRPASSSAASPEASKQESTSKHRDPKYITEQNPGIKYGKTLHQQAPTRVELPTRQNGPKPEDDSKTTSNSNVVSKSSLGPKSTIPASRDEKEVHQVADALKQKLKAQGIEAGSGVNQSSPRAHESGQPFDSGEIFINRDGQLTVFDEEKDK